MTKAQLERAALLARAGKGECIEMLSGRKSLWRVIVDGAEFVIVYHKRTKTASVSTLTLKKSA